MTTDPTPVVSTPAEPHEPEPDWGRIDELAERFERHILDEAANWGETFPAGPGQVCPVNDAARVLARLVSREEPSGPVTLAFREPSAEDMAEFKAKFAEAMAHPARLLVIPPTEDERVRAAYERGKAEGLMHAVEHVARLLGHDVVLHISQEAAEGMLASALETARELGQADCVRRHAVPVDDLIRAAREEGNAEGRRQATEGWEREWGAWWVSDGGVPSDSDALVLALADEDKADYFVSRSGGSRAKVSRLVGPWEPAEQPEPAESLSIAEETFEAQAEALAAHGGTVATQEPAVHGGVVPFAVVCTAAMTPGSGRPRMTDGCGPEHTYRGTCAYAEQGGDRG